MKALYAAAIVGCAVAISLILGVRIYNVNGNSMYPALKDGDCVLVLPASLKSPECGDVVVYERGELIVHRAIKKTESYLITKGDNLSESDGKVGYDSLRGTVLLTLPGGRMVSALFQAFCVSSMLLGVYAVVRIALVTFGR